VSITDKLLPIILSPNERADLGSVQKHPGVVVLIEKIMKGHAQQMLAQIHTIELDDPARTAKLDAICSVAYAMQKSLDLVRRELQRNWDTLRQEEEAAEKGKQ
jgi:hypothetical protein